MMTALVLRRAPPMTDTTAHSTPSNPPETAAPEAQAPGPGATAAAAAVPRGAGARTQRPRPRSAHQVVVRAPHPMLEQLAALYPDLFGAHFKPLKRGIFQDLLAAHPESLAKDGLKTALALHTRSTRYLQAVANGQPRHDLQGQPVEAMAPEHVHHALLEVFKRRQGRTDKDLRPALRARIAELFLASGLSREGYDALVRGRDEQANAVLDEAMAEAAVVVAKDEALWRAFEGSGLDLADFAGMYGLPVAAVATSLERAQQRRQSHTQPHADKATAASPPTEPDGLA